MRLLATLALLLALGTAVLGCKGSSGSTKATSTPRRTPTAGATKTTTPVPSPIPTVAGEPTVTSTGLKIIDVQVGSGAGAKATDTVTVNYTGYLEDGTVFDASSKHAQASQFRLNGVIQGWTEGVTGMKVGGKRRLIIPPDLAYGAQGRPPVISPNATLTFDIELVSIP